MTPTSRAVAADRPLLARLLDTRDLAHVVPRLHPEVLHRVIQNCGLEDCGELVALATPEQLSGVFDVDLWRPARPGLDERFDAARFGLWLEVMAESGAALAARQLAGMDADLLTAAFAQHVLVFDPAAAPPATSMPGEPMSPDSMADGSCKIGGYVLASKRAESWDAVVEVLSALAAEQQICFHRVMRGCRALSHSKPEVDGLDSLLAHADQVMFDLAVSREQRREELGFVTPAQARAFLEMSREIRLGPDMALPQNPIARAYLRTVESTLANDAATGPAASDVRHGTGDSAEAEAAIVGVLFDAGLLPDAPRALLDGPQGGAPRLARMQAHMRIAAEREPSAFSMRSRELAFLANTIAAGCSIQARPFTASEASDAAVAICNLGLENWPATPPDDFLVVHDLISVFQVGWTTLYDKVSMCAAAGLVESLATLQCDDRETKAGLSGLRRDLKKHWRAGRPWLARDALDVLAILDMPAHLALFGLIDECPVIHAGMGVSLGSGAREVSATAFEFISENSQIASVGEFLRLLPETLGP